MLQVIVISCLTGSGCL